jgi:hypothetical protein
MCTAHSRTCPFSVALMRLPLSWILSPFLNQRMLTFCILMCCPNRCITVTRRTTYTGMMDYMIVSEKKENNNTVSTVFMSIQFNRLLTSYIRLPWKSRVRYRYRKYSLRQCWGSGFVPMFLGLLDPDPAPDPSIIKQI